MTIIKKFNLKEYFFIRYWENGPHIRFRVKSEKCLFDEIKNEINKYISEHKSDAEISPELYSNISEKYAEKEKVSISEKNYICSNNTVQEVEYIPETEKFHGDKGVEIAEKEFMYSSLLALNIISFLKNKSSKIYFGAAFAKMLINCALEDDNEKRLFIKMYRQYWERFSDVTDEVLHKIEEIVCNINNSHINEIVKLYEKNGMTEIHNEIFNSVKTKIDSDKRCIFDFLMNFIHLYNNRIGITPFEEIETIMLCESNNLS